MTQVTLTRWRCSSEKLTCWMRMAPPKHYPSLPHSFPYCAEPHWLPAKGASSSMHHTV